MLVMIRDNQMHTECEPNSANYRNKILAFILKYGSEEKGSSLCRCSILLGFIMSKNLRGL